MGLHLRLPLFLLLALLLLIFALDRQPVTRSQEARVLLGAQAMTDRPPSEWLVPMLNGQPRFQKPPLSTWMVAISFKLLGNTDFAARLPNVLCGSVTLTLVFCWGRYIRGERAGLLAAVGLLGSLYFVRFSRLAETDAGAMPFVTLAYFAAWRLVHSPRDDDRGHTPDRALHYHLFAIGAALACLSKGGPGLFPFGFMLLISLANRSANILSRFVTSGAIITFAVIAVPWFAYAWLNPVGRDVLTKESMVMLRGGGHVGAFYDYFAWIAYGCLPWTAFGIAALWHAYIHWRVSRISRDLLIAVLSVIVPLLILPQKQPHYVMSLLPILFVLTGFEIDRMLHAFRSRKLLDALFVGTALTLGGGAIAMGAATFAGYGRVPGTSIIFAAALLTAIVITLYQFFTRGVLRALIILGVLVPPFIVFTVTIYVPAQLNEPSPRQTASEIVAQVNQAPLGWWKRNESLSLTYYLGRIVPTFDLDPHSMSPNPPPNVLLLEVTSPEESDSAPPGYRVVFSRQWKGDESIRVFARTPHESCK